MQPATHARVPALATHSTAAGPFVPVPYVAVGIRRATAGSRLLAGPQDDPPNRWSIAEHS